MKTKLLTGLLVLAAVLCILPMTVFAADTKTQCVCGGNAVGKPGHTCTSIEYQPWTSTTTLPSSGNYYLTGNVTTSGYRTLSNNLNLDLNGYNITRKLTNTATTQVFAVASNHSLSITDSTANPGTVSRDLSALTQAQRESINNWGLLIIVNKGYSGSLNLYGGIFDSTGCYSYGGSVISNSSTTYPINIYGGRYLGGITAHNETSGGNYGAVYSASNVNLYGGEITGATLLVRPDVTTYSAGVYTSGTLTIGGDAVVYGNFAKKSGATEATASNALASTSSKLVFSGTYTGTIGIVTAPIVPSNISGAKLATSSSANITNATIYLDDKPDYRIYLSGSLYIGQVRTQCECGGKAAGKLGHTCKDIDFIAWTNTTSLPKSGNWYLASDVTFSSARHDVTNNTFLRLDLNGKTLTRKVGAGTNVCVFGLGSNASMTITDSTDTPGTVTRDMTDYGNTTAGNYGMIAYIDKSCTGSFALYDGILDTTGTATTGYGSAIYCGSAVTSVSIYGGQIKAGTASKGVIYSGGTVTLMGGKITGGVVTNLDSAAIDLSAGGALILGGDAQVTGNTASNGTPANIKVTNNQLTIKGTFTGNVTITPAAALVLDSTMGTADNAVIQGILTLEGYPNYSLRVKGTALIVSAGYKALVDAGMNTYYYDSLREAIERYEGGTAVVKLLDDASDEAITVPQTVYLDLNGNDLGSATVTGGTLFLFDSQTDDFTVEDGRGYGKITSLTGDAKALPSGALFRAGYLMITETDGISLHRLNVDTTGVTLRSTNLEENGASVYYTSTFGGDEVVKRHVAAFGIAMALGQTPGFQNDTYTRHTDMSQWQTGSLNTFNSTLLKDIMKLGNDDSVNAANAATDVLSQAYVELTDGTRIMGGTCSISLQKMMEGTDTATGIDGLWETLKETQKAPVREMFTAFQSVMQNWKIPYIKHDVTGEELPYDDDGILKILLIGHSLGLDSGYFFPEVYKETTGKDVVLGMLYHSGCRLNQHVYYLSNNIKQYAYYEFDTRVDTNWRRADAKISEDAAMTFHPVTPSAGSDTDSGIISVTMKDGITRADWDLVIMQAGVFDAAGKQDDGNYPINTTADIKTIQQHVLSNDIEKRSVPKFGWNITWASPSSTASFWDSTENYVNIYRRHMTNFYWQYGKDANDMYADIAKVYSNGVTAAYDWDYLMPSGTALHNAKSLMADELLYRDVIHSTDFGRLMFAYVWTCQLEGKTMDDFTDITSIYSQLRYKVADRNAGDYVLTSNEKSILRMCVNAALENPLALTDFSK